MRYDFNYTNPKVLVLIASKILLLSILLDEYSGRYSREMHVFAVGSWWSLAGLTVTDGIG